MSSPKPMQAHDAASESRAGTLEGLRVLVTRPPQRALPLCAELERRGAMPIPVPAIEIGPCRDVGPSREAMGRLAHFDMAIFVSPSAVEHALGLASSDWPRALRAAAMGPGTRDALLRRGIEPAFEPQAPFDSEALLRCPELGEERVAGSRIALVKGEGGREHLARELRRRGARIDAIDVYCRGRPRDLGLRLLGAPRPDLVVLTSVQAARNVLDAAGEEGRARLAGAHFVVIGARVAGALRALGVESPASVARQASDAGLIEAMEEWAVGRP